MIRCLRTWPWLVALFVSCQWLAPAGMAPVGNVYAGVLGVTCHATMTSITFGNVQTEAGALGLGADNNNLHTTGYLTYYCSNSTSSAKTITACFSIGNPGGANQRSMRGGNLDLLSPLKYNLYQDSSETIGWGSRHAPTWGEPQAKTVMVPADGNSRPVTLPIYATIPSNQSTLGGILGVTGPTAGDYSANYGNADVSLDIADGAGANCSAATSEGNTFTPFNVTATIANTCQVTTNDMSFVATGTPSNATATTTLTVSCTSSHAGYRVGLDNGKNYAGGSRRMRGGPTHNDYIPYDLYQNSSYSTPWGNTDGTGNVVTGTQSTQTFNVYGKIAPGQGLPPPGDYFDAVTVYVYY